MTISTRRIDVTRLTPAETAIRDAMLAVEDAGADPLLTEAINLLQQARDKVADYVDRDILQFTPQRRNSLERKLLQRPSPLAMR